MKHFLFINQDKALQLKIQNPNQALIFCLLFTCDKWAEKQVVDGEDYYWVARQTICKELPILNLKPDTVYRYVMALKDLGVIEYAKVGKKDCFRISKKVARFYEFGAMSENNPNNGDSLCRTEIRDNSENNPNSLGKFSDISICNTINTEHDQKEAPPTRLNLDAWNRWIDFRKEMGFPKYKRLGIQKKLAEIPPDKQAECVEHSIDNNYQGLFPEKFKAKPTPVEETSKEKAARITKQNQAARANQRSEVREDGLVMDKKFEHTEETRNHPLFRDL